jgi:hypothetical protein
MGKQLSSVDWTKISEDYGNDLVQEVRKRLESGTSPEINPNFFASGSSEATKVTQLFDRLVDDGLLTRKEVNVCPTPGCENVLDEEISECSKCGVDYHQTGDEPQRQRRYIVSLLNGSRDVPWLIAIHGMNTDGQWQEEFSWRVANKFWYHAPVLIFKYGLVRYRVLFQFFHKIFTRRLGEKISAAIEHARQNGISEPPDIVVHSFGSLLFSYLLASEDFKDLKFGRVIVCGGVVCPDFKWSDFIAANRIEAVLNHFSKKDYVVRLAQFAIPKSGPLGAVGSSDSKVFNVREELYGHSTYFEVSELAKNLDRGGVWDIFLKYPLDNIKDAIPVYQKKPKWIRFYGVVRYTTRLLVILVVPLICLAAVWGFMRLSVVSMIFSTCSNKLIP